jgi:hypothetical protein
MMEAHRKATWAKLGPGLYHSSNGEMRIIASELLRSQSRPDTIVNRIKVVRVLEAAIKRRNPGATIITTNDPAPKEVEASL